jgi:CheY-like chemotaxis protein
MKPVRRGQLLHMIMRVLKSPEKITAVDSAVHVEKESIGGNKESIGGNMLAGVSVLVAEDNSTNRQVLTLLLEQALCRVTQAVNGLEALEKLTDDIQIVLMDVHMPMLDGISATRLILKKRPDVAVVYLTADVTEDTKTKCEQSGAVETLLKPVNKALLMTTLSRVLRERRLVMLEAPCLSPTVTQSKVERIRCLIVDDSNTNRALAGHMVRKVVGQDVEIVYADGGEAAVRSVSEQCPDLVLMDIKMPGMNGIDATRRIFQLQLTGPVVIVGLTGLDDAATIRDCKVAGMNLVLTKPLRENQLQQLISLVKRTALKKMAMPPSEDKDALIDDSFIRDLDPTVRGELLDDWRLAIIEHLRLMQELCTRSDWVALEDNAHSLKGSSAQVGAVLLSQVAATVEEGARSGVPNVSDLLAAVEDLGRIASLTLLQFGLKPI